MVESIFPNVAQQIYLIKPSLLNAEDTYCWYKTKTGIYSVRSGYYALREANDRQQVPHPQITSFKCQKHVWREDTSPKQKLYLWKMARGALPLGEELQRRGINVPGLRPHCLEPENALHLFFDCPFARQVWDLAPLSVTPNFDNVMTLHEAFTIMAALICLPPTGIVSGSGKGHTLSPGVGWDTSYRPPTCTEIPPTRSSSFSQDRCGLVQHGCSLGCKRP
ncbi:hypothetical protein HID58_037891 [Brassica napus]|uniref:Reverse transcriptase zinc-binding domain-containing protein n=1 Tax=Brassica napus TaxID=3708 RepID=A0ABQ8BMM4_BRANA|nr:hypothetical protein HID58_037891 [Brassica napus]